MEASLKLHDFLSARVASGDAEGVHGGFGSAVHQPQHLHAWKQLLDVLGELHFPLRGDAVEGALPKLLAHGVDDVGVGVSQHQGTVGHAVVHVDLSVGAVEFAAFGAVHKERVRLEGSDGAVDAAGQDFFGSFKEFFAVV